MNEVNNKKKESAKIILIKLCMYFGKKIAIHEFLISKELKEAQTQLSSFESLKKSSLNVIKVDKNYLEEILSSNAKIFQFTKKEEIAFRLIMEKENTSTSKKLFKDVNTVNKNEEFFLIRLFTSHQKEIRKIRNSIEKELDELDNLKLSKLLNN